MAVRDQIVRGTSDDKLREDALAKEHTVEDLVMKGQGYEQSRVNSKAIAGKPVARMELLETISNTEEKVDFDHVVAKLKSERFPRHRGGWRGGESGRGRERGGGRDYGLPKYSACHKRHNTSENCPATGEECIQCHEKGHFKGSVICKSILKAGKVAKNCSGQTLTVG